MRKAILASIVALSMSAGTVGFAGQLGGVTHAAKKAGEATADATKKGAETAAKETKKAATTTKDAVTGQSRATCADGTQQTADTQQKANAECKHHGGVARK